MGFFVKAEPKPVFSHSPFMGDEQKARPTVPDPQTGQHRQLLYVTSASQYPSTRHQQPAVQQSYMPPPRLSHPQRMPPPPRPAFLSTTPGVIVQANSVNRTFYYQPNGLEFSEGNFLPEVPDVGRFATGIVYLQAEGFVIN